MHLSASGDYLENEILTAAPERLVLLLIEGAIRSAERARGQWQSGDTQDACESLIRAQEIVGELLAGLNREESPELARRMAAYYQFVLRTLIEANLEHDEGKLDAALEVLAVERATWREVCQKDSGSHRADPPEPARPAAPAFFADIGPSSYDTTSGSLSFEA